MDELEKRAKEVLDLLDFSKNYMYFAHQADIANTFKEEEFISVLDSSFSEFKIYNPFQKHNQENYQLWKKEKGNGMEYYYEVILPNMEAGVYLAFKDKKIGAGAFHEAEYLIDKGKPVWEIDWNFDLEKINSMDYSRYLTPDETRERYK
ncbi:MAG TPA: hypothetical protein VJ912_02805 [Candidatus Nanoarchaeia archaeon]|nr:hypothetical protein [Candidatus Nanoarchaeia archaeon]